MVTCGPPAVIVTRQLVPRIFSLPTATASTDTIPMTRFRVILVVLALAVIGLAVAAYYGIVSALAVAAAGIAAAIFALFGPKLPDFVFTLFQHWLKERGKVDVTAKLLNLGWTRQSPDTGAQQACEPQQARTVSVHAAVDVFSHKDVGTSFNEIRVVFKRGAETLLSLVPIDADKTDWTRRAGPATHHLDFINVPSRERTRWHLYCSTGDVAQAVAADGLWLEMTDVRGKRRQDLIAKLSQGRRSS
jgi:hypothetical protein